MYKLKTISKRSFTDLQQYIEGSVLDTKVHKLECRLLNIDVYKRTKYNENWTLIPLALKKHVEDYVIFHYDRPHFSH